MRTRTGFILGGIALLIVVGGGSFYGGIAFQRGQQTSARDRFFSTRGGQPGEGGFPGGEPGAGGFLGGAFPSGDFAAGGQGANSRGVFGTVKSIDGDTVLVSTPQDVTTVKLTDSTVFQETVTSDRSALQPGQQISVRGDRDSSGTVTAVTLQILGEPAAP